ncbi:MAG: putative RND superfamily exporter protein [Flavobacteriales bacterium]|jgi:predicted RND superfamily exporter protein
MVRISQFWAETMISKRWLVLITTLVLMALAPLSFKNLYYDNSNEAYFIEHDPNLIAFDNLLEHFGDSEYLVVGVPTREGDVDIFSAETIRMVEEISTFLEDHEHVTQLRSLSRYQYTHDDDGMLATDDLFEDIDELSDDPSLLDKAREIMRGEILALESLVSRDFKHTRIAARVEYIKNENAHNVKLVSELVEFLEEKQYEAQGFKIKLSGVPYISERFETLTKTDQAVINPAMAVIILLILFIIFRSFFAMLTPLIVIFAALFFVTSFQGIMAWPQTAVSSALIPTTIILAIGTSVHVLVEFFQSRAKGLNPKDAARTTTRDLLLPILFTSLTTAIGFIALSVTELRPVRQFAILAAFGPIAIFVLATTALPALLSFVPWMPRNRKNLKEGEELKSPVQWLVKKLPPFIFKFRKALVVIGVLITLFSAYSITFMSIDTNVINYFKDNSRVNQDLHYFNDEFKGVANLELIVDSKQDSGVKNPEFLKRVESLQTWIEGFNETGKANSIIDFYKQINQSLHENDAAFFKLPDTRPMAAQFLLLYENTGPEEDLGDLKDFNEQYLRMSVPVINMDESQQSKFLNNVRVVLDKEYQDLSIEMTGSLVMNNAQNVYVNNGMFRSFSIAIGAIGIAFLVLYGSFKYGVIALIPSIVPIILTGGIISLAGISLDLGTMIVGAMTIGIAVDDSIHLMSRYLLQRKRGHTAYSAIEHALNSSGRAVMLSSFVLVTGFSAMLYGSFVPFIYVGLFSAMIMSFALIGDLIFMPAILLLLDHKEGDITEPEKLTNQSVEHGEEINA